MDEALHAVCCNENVFSLHYRSCDRGIDTIDPKPLHFKHIIAIVIAIAIVIVIFGIDACLEGSSKEAAGAAKKSAVSIFEATAEARKGLGIISGTQQQQLWQLEGTPSFRLCSCPPGLHVQF